MLVLLVKEMLDQILHLFLVEAAGMLVEAAELMQLLQQHLVGLLELPEVVELERLTVLQVLL